MHITFYSVISAISFVIIVYIIIKTVSNQNKAGTEDHDNSPLRNKVLMVTGVIIFLLVLFPYIVKNNAVRNNVGTGGRDSILSGIGTAIFLYYGLKHFFKQKTFKIVTVLLILTGIVHFNFMYLNWQECYYQQIQLRHGFADSTEIKNNDTFLVMSKGGIISTCFYQTNGNSWATFGNQKRFYMDGIKDLSYLFEETELAKWFLNAYMMNEYNYGERVIDGIIFVDYPNISRITLLKQKANEFFDKDAFNTWIDDIKKIRYVPTTKSESEKLKKLYLTGQLKESLIYDLFYR